MEVGAMIEIPSAAIASDILAREVDFFSIGTNDLIQYCLAVDRSNKDVANLYTAADPAVIRLIDMAVKAAIGAGRPISMCGQMCGNPLYTMLLIGIGLRSLSVTPSAVPEIKRVCRSVSLEQCQKIADQVRTLETARDVKTYLKEELSKVFPEFPV
jgi:phosphotransferase system enzyme I (PtsI)